MNPGFAGSSDFNESYSKPLACDRRLRESIVKRPGFGAFLLGLILATLPGPANPAGQPLRQTRAKDSHELQQIGNLEEFRSLFNRDTGVPRLILLLSPT